MKSTSELPKETIFYLVIIFFIGALAGFWLKSALKSKITNSPDDRKVVAVQQTFDFEKAKQEMEKEILEAQQAPTGTAVPQE